MFSSLFVCLPVYLLATLRKNLLTDLYEIFREGRQWANEQTIKFWSRSGSGIRIRIRIVTLVRRALAEVCTVPMLLVLFCIRQKGTGFRNRSSKSEGGGTTGEPHDSGLPDTCR